MPVDMVKKTLDVCEDKCGKTQILGLQGSEAVSPQELLARLTEAQAGRATRATQVNERLVSALFASFRPVFFRLSSHF